MLEEYLGFTLGGIVRYVVVFGLLGLVGLCVYNRVTAYLKRLQIADEYAEKKAAVKLHAKHLKFLAEIERQNKTLVIEGEVMD